MPIPRKRKNESWREYQRRITKHYIKEGYPPGQSYKIAESVVDRKKREQRNKH